jgi:hypothetical protein
MQEATIDFLYRLQCVGAKEKRRPTSAVMLTRGRPWAEIDTNRFLIRRRSPVPKAESRVHVRVGNNSRTARRSSDSSFRAASTPHCSTWIELLERFADDVVYPRGHIRYGQPIANSSFNADCAATETPFVRAYPWRPRRALLFCPSDCARNGQSAALKHGRSRYASWGFSFVTWTVMTAGSIRHCR